MLRIGVFGGSFDPVHNGHLLIARAALAEARLDHLLFMPVFIQPFKIDSQMTAGEHRLAMLELALKDEADMSVTDIELRMKEVSYTINSLRVIREKYPKGSVLSFIMGSDMFMMLEKWYKSEELLQEFSFIVASRPGSDDETTDRCAELLRRRFGADIMRLGNERADISSTKIREELKKNKLSEGRIPDAVVKYINENGLYR
ncbi:MAG: nicotinate (nicotinamide) nucleotide adenylyltransferase [Clostridiales Family XIII bacterium]|jgi:nicotinate-nucleotide adenylyltransferase|nr:nicotinate (nicotinamide) nucleotide adenylyltransferase [Clostridiales Family XIII bacterium]